METERATRTMGSMVLGSSVQMTLLRQLGRGLHKCLLISKHTTSPITLFLLSREAQPPPLVAIPLQTAPEVGHRA